jgi:hypothetical protein
MKLETIITPSKEIYLQAGDMSVTVNTWSNCEGMNVMIHGAGKDLPLRMACSLTWQEADVLVIALTAARAA